MPTFADLVSKAIDQPCNTTFAHTHVRNYAIAIAHASVAALGTRLAEKAEADCPSDIIDSQRAACALLQAASDFLMQTRREALAQAAQVLTGMP